MHWPIRNIAAVGPQWGDRCLSFGAVHLPLADVDPTPCPCSAPCPAPQTRTNETLCPSSKFDKIQKTCTGDQSVTSFGVDPVFKRGTVSYNADYDDVNNTKVGGTRAL